MACACPGQALREWRAYVLGKLAGSLAGRLATAALDHSPCAWPACLTWWSLGARTGLPVQQLPWDLDRSTQLHFAWRSAVQWGRHRRFADASARTRMGQRENCSGGHPQPRLACGPRGSFTGYGMSPLLCEGLTRRQRLGVTSLTEPPPLPLRATSCSTDCRRAPSMLEGFRSTRIRWLSVPLDTTL